MSKALAAVLFVLLMFFTSIVFAQSERVVHLYATDTEQQILEKAVSVVPTDQQYAWQQLELTAFMHWGMNTFTNKEIGDGTESPELFNPTAFDPEQWARTLKIAGFKQLILTARHVEGFCLWQTSTTDYSVKQSPYKNGTADIVKDVAAACKAAGIKFGFYISHWNRHESSFGTRAYWDLYKAQITELLTGYGEISEIWTDFACFSSYDPRCSNYRYEYDDYLELWGLIRSLQPNAIYMARDGYGIRWSGNEVGSPRRNEWSVIPQWEDETLPGDFGARDKILDYALRNGNLIWRPSESDLTIRPGFFYHSSEDGQVRSLSDLMQVYYNTTGNNSQLLLNVPPDARGLLTDTDANRLMEFKAERDRIFTIDYAKTSSITANSAQAGHRAKVTADGVQGTYWTSAEDTETATLTYVFDIPHLIDTVVLKEYIPLGQRIDKLHVDAFVDGGWKKVSTIGAVGYMKIVRFDPVMATKVRIRIAQARVRPTLEHVGIHHSGK